MQRTASPLEPGELEARRFELASRLADDLSHEIKNPLHAIVINLELVRRRITTQDTDAALDRIDVVEAELHRIHRLIDALLRVMRPSGHAGAVDLAAIIDELLPVLEGEAKVARAELRYAPRAEVAQLHADSRELKHAILQLLLLALDEAGGVPSVIDLTLDASDHGPAISLLVSRVDEAAETDGAAGMEGPGGPVGADQVDTGGASAGEAAERRDRALAFATAAGAEIAIGEPEPGRRVYALHFGRGRDT